jgi:hypothetical protein
VPSEIKPVRQLAPTVSPHSDVLPVLVPSGTQTKYDLGSQFDVCAIYMLVGARSTGIGVQTHTFVFSSSTAGIGGDIVATRDINPMFMPPGDCIDVSTCSTLGFAIPFTAYSGVSEPTAVGNATLYLLKFNDFPEGFDAITFAANVSADMVVFAVTAVLNQSSPVSGPSFTIPRGDEIQPDTLMPLPGPTDGVPAPGGGQGPVGNPAPPPTGNPAPPTEYPPADPPTIAPVASPLAPPSTSPSSPSATSPRAEPITAPVAPPVGCPQPPPFVPPGANLTCAGSSWIVTGSIVINATTAPGAGVVFTVQGTTLNPTVVDGCVTIDSATNATVQIDSSTVAALLSNKTLEYTLLQSKQQCLSGTFGTIIVQCADQTQCDSNCVNSTQQQTTRQLSVLFTAGCTPSKIDGDFIAGSLWWIILLAVIGFIAIVAGVILILARVNPTVRKKLFPFLDRRQGAPATTAVEDE